MKTRSNRKLKTKRNRKNNEEDIYLVKLIF